MLFFCNFFEKLLLVIVAYFEFVKSDPITKINMLEECKEIDIQNIKSTNITSLILSNDIKKICRNDQLLVYNDFSNNCKNIDLDQDEKKFDIKNKYAENIIKHKIPIENKTKFNCKSVKTVCLDIDYHETNLQQSTYAFNKFRYIMEITLIIIFLFLVGVLLYRVYLGLLKLSKD